MKSILTLISVSLWLFMCGQASAGIYNNCNGPNTTYQFTVNNQTNNNQSLAISGSGYNNDIQNCKIINAPPGTSLHTANCLTFCSNGETNSFIILPGTTYAGTYNYNQWATLYNGITITITPAGCIQGNYGGECN